MQLTDYRTLGRTGLRISPLTLGAMTFGDPSWGSDEVTSHAILDAYLEAGGNSIDTANGYTDGRSEGTIGHYLAQHTALRDRLVIATKFAGNLFPDDPNGGGAGRKAIMQQLDASLRRLGTDYVDLYWQHNWDRHTPLEETLSTLNALVTAGKVRYIGLSDTPAWAVARMATIAELRGWAHIAAIQVEYSLLERSVEGELFGAARELRLGVTPWSPLASGVLTGKYSRATTNPEGSGRRRFSDPRMTEATFTVLDRLTTISNDLGTPMAHVALAWVRQQPLVTSTLVGARTPEQLAQNLASLDLTLPEDIIAELDELTTPTLGFPAAFLETVAIPWQQGGATINGVESKLFTRD